MYVEQKSKIKSYGTLIIIALIIVFVSALAIISVYDYLVYDITNDLSELCAKYGFLVSPAC